MFGGLPGKRHLPNVCFNASPPTCSTAGVMALGKKVSCQGDRITPLHVDDLAPQITATKKSCSTKSLGSSPSLSFTVTKHTITIAAFCDVVVAVALPTQCLPCRWGLY